MIYAYWKGIHSNIALHYVDTAMPCYAIFRTANHWEFEPENDHSFLSDMFFKGIKILKFGIKRHVITSSKSRLQLFFHLNISQISVRMDLFQV